MCINENSSSKYLNSKCGEKVSKVVETVIGIPGNWDNIGDLSKSLGIITDEIMIKGSLILNTKVNEIYEVELYDYDEEMWKSFSYSGNFSESDLEEIDKHKSTVYVIAKTKDIESLKNLINVVTLIVKAGGLAVKVESSGTALSKRQWFEIKDKKNIESLIEGFVSIYTDDENIYYSCGMHIMGYEDVKVQSDESEEVIINLIRTFLKFLLLEEPSLENEQFFSLDSKSKRYVLYHEECTNYPEEDLFYNPFGIWSLRG